MAATIINILTKTLSPDGEETIFGPYFAIRDYVMVSRTLRKHLGTDIQVSIGERDGEYILAKIENNAEFRQKLKNICEPFVAPYDYPNLKNHHLKFEIY